MAISYPRLSPRGLRGLSIFNIILWVFSSVLTVIFTYSFFFPRLSSGKKYIKCISRIYFLQIAIVIRYSNFGQGPDYNNIGGLDYIFAGIWAGWFYGVAGIVGIVGSYERKRVQ
jgi:hypothetical protein